MKVIRLQEKTAFLGPTIQTLLFILAVPSLPLIHQRRRSGPVLDPQQRANMFLVLGRLKPGVTLQRARSDMASVYAQFRSQYPDLTDKAEKVCQDEDAKISDLVKQFDFATAAANLRKLRERLAGTKWADSRKARVCFPAVETA